MKRISIIPTHTEPCQAICIGSVNDVIAGYFPKQLENKRFNAHSYQYGFLVASPKDKHSLGEAIILNNYCYVTSTDKEDPNYNKTIIGSNFITNGIVLIPHEAQPNYTVHLDLNQGSIQLIDFYNELYQSIDHPLMFVGLIQSTEFYGTAIGKPPIEDLNIFTYHEDYYPFSPIESKNVQAFIIGALTNYNQIKYESINKQLEKILYRTSHPGDTTTYQLCNHAHVLILKNLVANITDITPSIVQRVLHLLTDKTMISFAHLDVFALNGLKTYVR